MELHVLNASFEDTSIIDSYKSLIWTDRYQEAGDFELVAEVEILNYIQIGYYIFNQSSEHMMIVESIQINTDAEEGNYATISGRSLESILDRRIIWSQTNVDGELQAQIKKLVNQNAISPTNADRTIPNLIFSDSTDTRITSNTLTAQYTGDNLYEVICAICQTFDIGWKITLNSSNQFIFKLYCGTDHSYSQSTNPYVIFSPEFDNIVNSNHVESTKEFKNVTLVAGEGEGTDRTVYSVGTASGLARRELYTDARDLSSNPDSESPISAADYQKMLETRGEEKLSECKMIDSFDGEVDYRTSFIYGTDYFTGDICEMINEYGMGAKIRVVESVISVDSNGKTIYPTFSAIEEEDE